MNSDPLPHVLAIIHSHLQGALIYTKRHKRRLTVNGTIQCQYNVTVLMSTVDHVC